MYCNDARNIGCVIKISRVNHSGSGRVKSVHSD